MSVQGLHILIPFSSTSILELGQARTQELESTTKLSDKKKGKINNNVEVQQKILKQDILGFENYFHLKMIVCMFLSLKQLCLNISTWNSIYEHPHSNPKAVCVNNNWYLLDYCSTFWIAPKIVNFFYRLRKLHDI